MEPQVEFTKKKKIKFDTILNKQPMSTGKSLVWALVISLIGFFVQSVLQNGLFSVMHFVYFIYPAVLIFNLLPVFLIVSLFYFLTNRLWVGTVIAFVPLILMNIANYYKVLFRDEPLKMSDLQLINEMGNITQNYEFKIPIGIIAGVVLAIAAIVFAVKFIKSQKIKWNIRIIGAATAIVCMMLSYQFIYTNKKLYDSIPTFAVEYHDTSMANHHGMLYSFLISSQSAKYEMPEGYTDELAEEILSEQTSGEVTVKNDKKINVIAIMGEAFFDVNNGTGVGFENGENPYKNFERIKSEGYYGDLIVSGFGGSTESTEFEFLTGANLYLLSESLPTAYKTYITENAYSLVKHFKDSGYDTLALHPGYGWFYNRQSAYPRIGFDSFLSREDMDEDAPRIYGYIEDEYTVEQIISNYEKHYNEKPDTPYFNFTITIQNHGPYPAIDYGRDIIYTRPENISDENYYIINNYLNGVRDTDELLGSVCDFAAGRQEPVVVVFFGDHLPKLDNENVCYEALGYNIKPETQDGIKNKYTVEYVIWSNEAAQEIIKENMGEVKKGEGPEISSNYLGAELLDYMGMEKGGFFSFVSEAEKRVNVISSNYYQSGDERVQKLNPEDSNLMGKYKILQYYNLRRYNKD